MGRFRERFQVDMLPGGSSTERSILKGSKNWILGGMPTRDLCRCETPPLLPLREELGATHGLVSTGSLLRHKEVNLRTFSLGEKLCKLFKCLQDMVFCYKFDQPGMNRIRVALLTRVSHDDAVINTV